MEPPLKILLLEDNPADADLIRLLLTREGWNFTFQIVSDQPAFTGALNDFVPDVILSDNSMPQFSAREALGIVRKKTSHVPFILVTGTVSEEFAAAMIKEGADDFILKDRMGRLPAAINIALLQRKTARQKTEASDLLHQQEESYRHIMERISDGFIAVDINWRYTYLNNKAGEILLRNPDELIGKNMWVEFPLLADMPFYNACHAAMETQEYLYLEVYYPPFDVWVENHLYPSPDGLSVFFRDISERKAAEQKIIASEENLKAIFENSSEGFVLIDTRGVIKTFNHWALKSINLYTSEEVVPGKNIYDLIGSPRKEIFEKMVEQVLQGETLRFDRSYNLPNKPVTWINFTINPVRENNQINGICITARDISERKIAEEQQEFDRNNLYALINNTGDMMWSVDRDYRLITSNHAFDKMVNRLSGIPPFKGMNILDMSFAPELHARYKDYYQRAFSGETFTVVEHTKYPDETWSAISFNPVFEGETVVGTACFSRDITVQRKAEIEIAKSNERFELVASATNDVIWDWDLITGKLSWNKNFYTHFGYTQNIDSSTVNSWEAHVHPHDKERVLTGIYSAIERKDLAWSDEYRFLKADHSVAFILDCGYILYDDRGESYRMVGAMLDITERKKGEERLKQSLIEQATLANRMAVILNGLPANIALLDHEGVVIEVNDAWKNFAESNGYCGVDYGVGDNYLKVSRDVKGKEKADGKRVATGIRAVIDKEAPSFVFEYPCHTPDEKRWFRMVVTPLENVESARAVVMHTDISELRRLEQERMESRIEEQLKITEAIFDTQEKERNAIGLELHDNVNQILAVTTIQLSMIRNIQPEAMELVQSSLQHLQNAIGENRKMAHTLVIPDFDTKSLADRIETLTENMLQSSGTQVTINTRYFREDLLTNDQKLAIFRILQEQCNNIVKYADADYVSISLETNASSFKMVISDDGKGADKGKKLKGIGLSNINNRLNILNGSSKVTSTKGKGFKLEIEIPITT